MTMVPFKYVDFYDVPRLIMFRYQDRLFLLASYFDANTDNHDDSYAISILPPWVEQKIAESSWQVLEDDIGAKPLGEIAVKDVVFDKTKRHALDPTFLDKYLNLDDSTCLGADDHHLGLLKSSCHCSLGALPLMSHDPRYPEWFVSRLNSLFLRFVVY